MLSNRLAIASVSLGQHDTHTLPQKIEAAAVAGIQGIEITYPDLDDHATQLSVPLLEAAESARRLCEEKSMEIIAFASFQNYEGQQSPLQDRLHKARDWLRITSKLGAAHLQMPSNYDRSASSDCGTIISELRQLSDLAQAIDPAIKIAYENLGWGTHCHTWQQALQIVQDVDKDNFGLCLDSFHFCVDLWADPFRTDGKKPDGPRKLQASLRELVQRLPLNKLFYLQLSDGELLEQPYSTTHPWYDPGLEPGHVWSNEARPFPLETDFGGYMPVREISKAFLIDLGYTGWVSLESFDRRMKQAHQGPARNAQRAMSSWRRLEKELTSTRSRTGRL
ncbi:3-dehydroshikimate dehydratase-like protein 2 [Elsinoe fawcettii]|nr:3-dehydroshikimate dehydratase-like protein 2 [Elsinoe fawcettii]